MTRAEELPGELPEEPTPPATPPDTDAAADFWPRLTQTIAARGDWCGQLMAEIARVLRDGGDWCDGVKAQTLAALVLGLRPRVICEVGVWIGGSMIPMLLALRTVEEIELAAGRPAIRRQAIAVDAWSAEASCAGQEDADRAWWSAQSHEDARQTFLHRLTRHDVARLCDVVHARSSDAPVPPAIGLLHLDGNHGAEAVRDVDRFAGNVEAGGILVLDDLDWAGGHVAEARDRARGLGFRDLFPLGTGIVLQRVA